MILVSALVTSNAVESFQFTEFRETLKINTTFVYNVVVAFMKLEIGWQVFTSCMTWDKLLRFPVPRFCQIQQGDIVIT